MKVEKLAEKKRLTSWRPPRRKKSVYFWLVLVQYLIMLFLDMELLLLFGNWVLWLIGLVAVNGWFITDVWRQVTDAAESRTMEIKIGSAPAYTVKRFFPRNLSHTLHWVNQETKKTEKRAVISEFQGSGGWLDVPHDDGHPSPLMVATAWDSRMSKDAKEEQKDIEIPNGVREAMGRTVGGPIDPRHVFAGTFQGQQYYIPCEPILVQIRDLPADMRRFALGMDDSYTLETPVLWGPDRMDEPHKVPPSYESNLACYLLNSNRELEEERDKNELLREEIQALYMIRGMYGEPQSQRTNPPGVR